jgi:hypothetical protein
MKWARLLSIGLCSSTSLGRPRRQHACQQWIRSLPRSASSGRGQCLVAAPGRRSFPVALPGTTHVWVAPPFCAVLTDLHVRALGKTYWAACVLDPLGIAVALGANASIAACCPDSARGRRWTWRTVRSLMPKASSTLRFPLPVDGRTSPSLEGGCGSSGRRSTSTVGSPSGRCVSERRCHPSSVGNWHSPGPWTGYIPSGVGRLL